MVTKFDTGAVRDGKPVPLRWDLISGVALRRIAEICTPNEFAAWSQFSPMELVGFACDTLFKYISGDRSEPWLRISFRHLMYAIHIHGNDHETLERIQCLHGPSAANLTGFQNLSWIALRHLASTCEEGRGKYGEWNWLFGFPFWNTASHALDHMFAITNGHHEEDDWGHALWNLHVSVHNEDQRPDLFGLMLDKDYTMTKEIQQSLAEFQAKRQEMIERGLRSVDTVRGVPAGGVDLRNDHHPRRTHEARP